MKKIRKFRKEDLVRLRADIKGYMRASRAQQALIGKSSGDERHAYKCLKANFGAILRVKLVAYGLMRGVPYEVMEKHSIALGDRSTYEKFVDDVMKEISFAKSWCYGPIKDFDLGAAHWAWTKEAVEFLLTEPCRQKRKDLYYQPTLSQNSKNTLSSTTSSEAA